MSRISDDSITEEQSGQILKFIKTEAHKEMFKRDGYIKRRVELLNPSQISELLQKVGTIIHDRDTKLTDSRYYTVTDLLMALDDHNTMVKEILLRSWYKCPGFTDESHCHLEEIKSKVQFYETLSQCLSFDIKESLAQCKSVWDRHFPGLRTAGEGSSELFVNTTEVRGLFKNLVPSLLESEISSKLIDVLPSESANVLFEEREARNLVRNKSQHLPPLVSNQDMTVGEFLMKFFPEVSL